MKLSIDRKGALRAGMLLVIVAFAFSNWLPYINYDGPLCADESAHLLTVWFMGETSGDFKSSMDLVARQDAFESLRQLHPEENESVLWERAEEKEIRMYRSPIPFIVFWRLSGTREISFRARLLVSLVLVLTMMLVTFHFKDLYIGIFSGIIFLSSSVSEKPWFMMEPFQCLFLTAAVLLLLKGRHDWAMFSLVLGFLFKETTLLFVAAFGFHYLLKKDWKHLGFAAAAFLLCFGIYYVYSTSYGVQAVDSRILSSFNPQALIYSMKYSYNLAYLTPVVLLLIIVGLRASKERIFHVLVATSLLFFMTIPARDLGVNYDYWEYIRYAFHPIGGILAILAGSGVAELLKTKK